MESVDFSNSALRSRAYFCTLLITLASLDSAVSENARMAADIARPGAPCGLNKAAAWPATQKPGLEKRAPVPTTLPPVAMARVVSGWGRRCTVKNAAEAPL